MKNKFTAIIMTIITILIICVLVVFGLIFIEEFQRTETTVNPELFQTIIDNDLDTIEKNIETPEIIENSLNGIQDANNTSKVDYSSVQVDKYFYNQLEEPSKTI